MGSNASADFASHWALSTEMHEYNPFTPFEEEETVASTPGLGEAYAIANSALEAGLGLKHWRTQVEKMTTVILSDSEDADVDFEDDMNDAELQWALHESRKTIYGKAPRWHDPPGLSRLKQSQQENTTWVSYNKDRNDNKTQRRGCEMPDIPIPPGYTQPSRRDEQPHSPVSALLEDGIMSGKHRKCSPVRGRCDQRPAALDESPSSRFHVPSAPDDILRLSKGSTIPTSDVVDGDL